MSKPISRADFLARVLALVGVGVAVIGLGSPAPGLKTETDSKAIRTSVASQAFIQPYASQLDFVSNTGTVSALDGGQATNPNNGVLENLIDLSVSPDSLATDLKSVSNALADAGINGALPAVDHVHPLLLNTKNKSVDYQMTTADCVIRVTTGTIGKTITLPIAGLGTVGMVCIIMKVDSGVGAVTVQANGTNTILGGSITLAAQGSETMVRGATSTSWEKVSSL